MNFGKSFRKCLLLVFSLAIIVPQIANADPLDNWHWRSSLPGLAVTFANGTFVAVGDSGTIGTSSDALTWTQRTSGTSQILYGVGYGNGTFVAVGPQGLIIQSDPVVTTSVSCTVTTNPPGLQITVDGFTNTSPQTFDWSVNSTHTISVSSPQTGTPGTLYVFSSWSDGLAPTHTVNTPYSSTTYTANFGTQYRLTTSANPTAGGTVSPTGTNWYNSGQSVPISKVGFFMDDPRRDKS